MGAVLDAAVDKYGTNLLVADPFSGGGTVTIEAAQRGLKAYAQDIHAWPARGLSVSLATCSPDELQQGARELLSHLAPLKQRYSTLSGAELSHVLRVKTTACGSCERETYRFPGLLVSVKSRSIQEQQAYFGCCGCGGVSLRPKAAKSFTCGHCQQHHRAPAEDERCVHCGDDAPHRTVRWHAVLVQEVATKPGAMRSQLRPVEEGDPVEDQQALVHEELLAEAIPAGVETQRLISAGFTTWRSLYSFRQMEVIARALQFLREAPLKASVRDRLAYSVIGCAEMPAYLSRWDRFHMKAFEAMANHRFGNSNFVVETNLLSPVGRGTLARRIESTEKALNWLIEAGKHPRVLRCANTGLRRNDDSWDVLIKTGSSLKQGLANGTVDVVVTDPPYYDDVQYGELAQPLHLWLKQYDPSTQLSEDGEAVPNTKRGVTSEDYTATIAAVLTESRRTLREDGRLVLTFHNRKLVAWQALARAIHRAGFSVDALAVVLAENAADHCKRDVNAMLHDLVIECVPATGRRCRGVHVPCNAKSMPEKNLIAMGLALSELVAAGESFDLAAAFERHLRHMRVSRRLIS